MIGGEYMDNVRRRSREAAARYRRRHKKVLKQRRLSNYKELRDWADGLKEGIPCKDCNKEFPPYVMDWDHVRGRKVKSVSDLCATGANNGSENVRKAIMKEITKCELVCSNCHRIRTHERRGKERRYG